MEEFQLSLRNLDNKLLTIKKNLIKISQYIHRVITPPNDRKPYTVHQEWDPLSMVGSFNQLNQYALINSNNGLDSSRLHFAIRCAKGGLAANAKIFLGLAQELTAAFATCRNLRMEYRAAAETDGELKNTLRELSEYMKEMGARFMGIKEVIYMNPSVEAPLESPKKQPLSDP